MGNIEPTRPRGEGAGLPILRTRRRRLNVADRLSDLRMLFYDGNEPSRFQINALGHRVADEWRRAEDFARLAVENVHVAVSTGVNDHFPQRLVPSIDR